LKTGAFASTRDLFYELTMKKHKNTGMSNLLLLAAILAQWRQPLASSEALDILHWAMPVVLYRHTAMAMDMVSKVGAFCCCCFCLLLPCGRWGDTEQVVAQWWHPVASSIAPDMLHWDMCIVLHQRIHKAFKMGRDGGTF
jgi:hypothetical protein